MRRAAKINMRIRHKRPGGLLGFLDARIGFLTGSA